MFISVSIGGVALLYYKLTINLKNSVYIFLNFFKKFSSSFAFFSSLLNTYAAQS